MPGKSPHEEEKPEQPSSSGTFNRVREYEVSVSMWPDDPPEDESLLPPPNSKERSGVGRIRTPEEADQRSRRR